jgi:threonine dehydratase
LFHPDEIEGDNVFAVCTGGNVDADMFKTALDRFA